jgi:RNA polymerase sigma factor (sigma-70 family)
MSEMGILERRLARLYTQLNDCGEFDVVCNLENTKQSSIPGNLSRYISADHVIEIDDDGDEITEIELRSSDAWTPEDACIKSETDKELHAVLASLSLENQKVVKMPFTGYSKAEIADSLKISRAAVSQRLKTISRQFAALDLEMI